MSLKQTVTTSLVIKYPQVKRRIEQEDFVSLDQKPDADQEYIRPNAPTQKIFAVSHVYGRRHRAADCVPQKLGISSTFLHEYIST
jgi:hypothetical protein